MILLILKTSRTYFQPNGPKVAKKKKRIIPDFLFYQQK